MNLILLPCTIPLSTLRPPISTPILPLVRSQHALAEGRAVSSAQKAMALFLSLKDEFLSIYLLRPKQSQINTRNIRGQISKVKNRPALLPKDCTMLPVQCVVFLVLTEIVTEAHVLFISHGQAASVPLAKLLLLLLWQSYKAVKSVDQQQKPCMEDFSC